MTDRMSIAEWKATQTKAPVARWQTGDTKTPAESVACSQPPKTNRKPNTAPANNLTKAVLSLLALLGCRVWRQNNGGVYDPTRQVFRKGSSTPGISDIMGYHLATGRFIAVEIKAKGDKLSPEQTQFLDEVRHAGGFACEGRSVSQVETEFKAYLSQQI